MQTKVEELIGLKREFQTLLSFIEQLDGGMHREDFDSFLIILKEVDHAAQRPIARLADYLGKVEAEHIKLLNSTA